MSLDKKHSILGLDSLLYAAIENPNNIMVSAPLCVEMIDKISTQERRVEELEKTLSKCERVIRVPANENTADDYDLKA